MTTIDPINRRRALKVLGATGLAVVVGCSSDDTTSTASSSTSTSGGSTTTGAAATGATQAIPEETAGPYPADGSNGPNVLTEDGIVRNDITSSFGSSSTVATGVPTTIELTIVKAGTGEAYDGAAVYLWHCDQQGRYSLYTRGVTGENYLRGVQAAGADGTVTFTTIFPGAYKGRWPHIHFEVYPSLDAATSAGNNIATSQLALPEDTSNAVYATSGYEQSVSNIAGTSLTTDMVFRDGADQETPTVTGGTDGGFTMRLTVPV